MNIPVSLVNDRLQKRLMEERDHKKLECLCADYFYFGYKSPVCLSFIQLAARSAMNSQGLYANIL